MLSLFQKTNSTVANLLKSNLQSTIRGQKKRWVYLFQDIEEAENLYNGDWDKVRLLLGGKGANLAKMYKIGITVPPGYTITTECCNEFLKLGGKFPQGMWDQSNEALRVVEKMTGKKLGDPNYPLLVACRSGAYKSMPGMMDTVLNIGLNDKTAEGLCKISGDPRFVYDSYRRLVQGFGAIVLGLDDEEYEHPLAQYKKKYGFKYDNELQAENWIELTRQFQQITKNISGIEFPQDPIKQYEMSIKAVFNSWNVPRAIQYRKQTGIPDHLGTAVNIVTMVFGNMGEVDSGTGVAFTRNPSNGNKEIFGEFLFNAQGEDVVAGIRNTLPISALNDQLPGCYKQFIQECTKLENYYKEMQDVEFTIEKGKLYFLQTRDAKRTAFARFKTMVDMVEEGLIDKKTAIKRISPSDVDMMLHPQFDPNVLKKAKKQGKLFGKGVAASPGAAVGRVYFNADKCEEMSKEGPVIMCRPFTKPDDVNGMFASKGLFTAEGGATSHAAVVARQFGTPCVVGTGLVIDDEEGVATNGKITIREGDWVSVNGTTGEIFKAKIDTIDVKLEDQKDLLKILGWCDEFCAQKGTRNIKNGPNRGLMVWANADTAEDALRARKYGAQGIGLCRTEHQFLGDRAKYLRTFIMSEDKDDKKKALDKLRELQTKDFEELFIAMTDLPVIIRLLDPPLHEFLPDLLELTREVYELRGKGQKDEEKESLLKQAEQMHESNPMLGLRGVRLVIIKRELVEMQATAIIQGAINAKKRGYNPDPEIMIPLVGHINELKELQPEIDEIAKKLLKKNNTKIDYKIGTMIEIPRACLVSGELTKYAEFFSFGTNDLTQMTFGYSRDDAEGGFLLKYVEDGILPCNPFQSVDQIGVGRLIKMCVDEGRESQPQMDIGVCGEHGGDPKSIKFFSDAGLSYVSCSSLRVPVARLSACQAILD
ncbi:pyruvate phosphate dikinase 1 [Anaeramoeba flamelloides]|uniref:Pyruvate, phosphate dikinase n=1 Tax=Anaeramoeba flamelloides TaxID=1746091 RepID=A0AAV7Z103_9EUKA|nr:pyruvate phosphate dikinase 1 [Anaeramoeba flamelloides]